MDRHTDGFQDWYRIMQVHYLAEPEVIEGAYKRLSKKYHPDTSKDRNAEAKMKLINQAYAVLSDVDKRREYDRLYQQRVKLFRSDQGQPEQLLAQQAAGALNGYFSGLASHHYEAAYALITAEDKKYISKADFIIWQSTVNELYEIGDFQCTYFRTVSGKATVKQTFTKVFEFQVSLAELDRSSGKVNHRSFLRMVALEKDEFKVYLGYQDIKAIIAKFKQLVSRVAVAEETGFDRPRLCREIELEMARANRYARPFSIVLLETITNPPASQSEERQRYEALFERVLQVIQSNLRQTDCCGRWGQNRVMVILPETRLFAAVKTYEKLCEAIKALKKQEAWDRNFAFCAGITQYQQTSLQEFLDLLTANVIAAKSRGEWQKVF